jgi:hypothetical protein
VLLVIGDIGAMLRLVISAKSIVVRLFLEPYSVARQLFLPTVKCMDGHCCDVPIFFGYDFQSTSHQGAVEKYDGQSVNVTIANI